MQNTTKVEVMVGRSTITIETGLLAQQAKGAVTVRLGDSVLFSAVTATDAPREGIDYFPLQVEYREKYYAAGKFPGGFFKRESKPSEKEVLTARFTDRPLRPLFPKGYNNDVQIANIVLSADGVNEPDILSITAASAALMISDLPFMGPVGAVRVGRINGNFVINPTQAEQKESDLDLIYAGLYELPLMIEGDAKEIAEEDLLRAMRFAHAECRKLIEAQIELRRKMGLPDKVVTSPGLDTSLQEAIKSIAGSDIVQAYHLKKKVERHTRIKEIKEKVKLALLEKNPELDEEAFRAAFDAVEIEVVRNIVLKEKQRVDGRAFDEIRQLSASVSVLPRSHGSALFNRGETQALATATLGSHADSQELDVITGGPKDKKFMLHYNFPPFSVGEVGKYGSPGRREIGHGNLAERSLEQVMPKDYPYTVRIVSDIMSSNGSTSMASVCAGCLALMDAGVPISKPVAGISIGLFSSSDTAFLVTDIIGEEDHCGDMDFKVAGTRDGITGFQVDLKIPGLKWELVEGAFQKAKQARLMILDFMQSIISSPRSELSKYAPRVSVVKISPEKIGELIGPGGKNIRRITDMTGTQIDIDDDGTVHIFSSDASAMEMALREVSMIGAEAEEGAIYNGKVTGIKDFGVFVEIFPGKDGLVHISELSDCKVRRVEDVCKIGDQMWVKCIGIDERGRIKLSRKAAMKEKGLAEELDASDNDIDELSAEQEWRPRMSSDASGSSNRTHSRKGHRSK